jgi:ABC-type transport system involved in multi-copper enzyme maturation permease subunit
MLLPPVIERELRDASRRPLTYWSRLFAGTLCLLVLTPILLMFEISARFGGPGMPVTLLGPMLFSMFAALACFTAVAAGWFFATDALSLERREGTLELLFLAPLRPRDVVLGKLVTVTWRGAQWLLAVIPLFALPLLLGGVEVDHFLHLSLLTANTLFWSVACGLWASAQSRQIFGALVTTAILQLALVSVPLLVDLGLAGLDPKKFIAQVSYLSPAYTWSKGFSRSSPDFWQSLLLTHAEAWILLTLTIRTIARQIRENPTGAGPGFLSRLTDLWKYGRPTSRAAFRKRVIECHPVRWLVERERGPLRFLVALPLVITLSGVSLGYVLEHGASYLVIGSIAGFLLSVSTNILLALQASRFLVEARRTGALELLLVSPLSTRSILSEQCRSLIRAFAVPVIILLAIQIAIAAYQISMTSNMPAMPVVGPNQPGATAAAAMADMARFQWLNLVANMLVQLTGLASVAWVGFWMGMTCRQASLALFATLALSKLLPMLSASFLQASLLPSVLSQRLPAWLPFVASAAAGIAVNLGLVFLARHQLLPDLRRIALAPFSVVWPNIRLFNARPKSQPPTPPVLIG